MIKEIPCTSANQLKSAFRKNSGTNDLSYDSLSEVTSNCCRFYNSRHSCQPIHCAFFQHAPDRKIECVDMNSNSFLRNQDMMSHKVPGLTQRNGITICAIGQVRKFSSQRSITEQV